MRTFDFVIRNEGGLSGDPAVAICSEAERYVSHVCIERGNIRLSAQSIMGLIALQAACGDKLRVIIYGNDEELAEKGVRKILEEELG